MQAPISPKNEKERLGKLQSLNILDTPSEERFDRITRLVCRALHVPICAVSLIDENRQWFKSIQGIDARETGRDISFCGHAIHGEYFVVNDAQKDERFHDNPLVKDAPHIAFYAGVTLRATDGLALGTLCAIDTQPRTLTDEEKEVLHDLAAIAQIELQTAEMKREQLQLRHELKLRTAVQADLSTSHAMLLDKNMELERKNKEISLAHQHKSEFLANMSHELRTPLNSILLLSKMLVKNSDSVFSQKQVEHLRLIGSAGDDLLDLINGILDLAKIEAGRMEPIIEPILLDSLAQRCNDEFTTLAETKKLEFVVKVHHSKDTTIKTDIGWIRQILKNLLSNAFKFTSHGRVSLDFKVDVTDIYKPILIMDVKDTGKGIPEDKHDIIFEAFRQVDGSIRRQFGGTGLGLSITQKLVRLLNGTIEVSSKPNEGTQFRVCIPLATTQIGAVSDFAKQSIQTGIADTVESSDCMQVARSGTILIIESNIVFAQTLSELIEEQGAKSMIANTGTEGVELAKSQRPTGIMLDIHLPDADGLDILTELKKSPETATIPVQIVTTDTFMPKGIHSGAVGFLTKPITEQDVGEMLSQFERLNKGDIKDILVVEDDDTSLQAMRAFLEDLGFITIPARDCETAQLMVDSQTIDCVLLDLNLPDKPGWELLQYIRKESKVKNIPVLIVTGEELGTHKLDQLSKVADDILIKSDDITKTLQPAIANFVKCTLGVASRVPTQAETRSQLPKNNESILIVDDDQRNIAALQAVLESQGFTVSALNDGALVCDFLQQHKEIDVVLLDMMMPGIDGEEVLKRIQQDADLAQIPVIAVTAHAQETYRKKCLAAGARDFITKPVDDIELVDAIKQIRRQREKDAQLA